MSILKLTKKDITSNNSSNNNGEKLKLKKSDLVYDAATYSGWEVTNKSSLEIINNYNTKIQNNEYLSADDIKTYRTAIDSYIDSSNKLRGLSKIFGSGYTEEEEKKWTNDITSLNTAYDTASKYYSNWKTEDDYKDSLAAWDRQEEMLSFDLETGKIELDEMKSKYETAKPLESAKQAYQAKRNSIYSGKGSSEMKERKLKQTEEYKTYMKLKAKWSASYGDESWEDFISYYDNNYPTKNAYYRDAENLQTQKSMSDSALKSEDFDAIFKSGEEKGLGTHSVGFVGTDGTKQVFGSDVNNKIIAFRNNRNADGIPIASVIGGVNNSNPYTEEIKIAQYMTDEEYNTYVYYYAQDEALAEQYLDSIMGNITSREAGKLVENVGDSLFLKAVFGFGAGLDQFKSGMENLFSDKDYYAPTSTQIASAQIREDLADDSIPLWYNFKTGKWENKIFGNSLGQAGYDLLNTTGNMLPSILIGTIPVVGQVAGAASMGLSAAGNAKAEMINLGYSKEQANLYAGLVGVSEAGLQYLLGGISKLGGKASGNVINKVVSKVDNAFARTAIKLGGSMASEGLEEGLQAVLEPWFKHIATGVDFEAANIDEILYSGLLGALSAGFLEGRGTIAGEVNIYKTGKQVKNIGAVNRLTELGKTFSADTVAGDIARKVNENTGAYTIGRLFYEAGATLTEVNKTDIVKALEERGMSSTDAQANAKWMSNVIEGATLTSKQKALLESNDVLAKTMQEVIINPNSTVNQRSQPYNEVDFALNMINKGDAKVGDINFSETEAKVESDIEDTEDAKTIDSSINTETKPTSNISVSTDGKTNILNEDGERVEVSINEIASIKNGAVSLRLNNGEVVDAHDVEFASRDEGLIYEAVADMNMNTATANAFVKGFNSSDGISAGEYILGFNEAYKYGSYSFPVAEMSRKGFSARLSEAQRHRAYELGRIDRETAVKKEQSNTDKKVEKAKKSTVSKTEKVAYNKYEGETHISELKTEGLTERQRDSINYLKPIYDAFGINVYFFESSVVDGKRVGENGYYNPADKSIHIDLFAGMNGEQTILFTAAHELTHLIKDLSASKFKVFADFLFEQYGKKGVPVDKLVADRFKKIKESNRYKDKTDAQIYDIAYEEVVADACETMLTDSNAIEKIAQLKAKDKTLWQTIKDFIADLVTKIKNLYAGLKPNSVEANYVREMVDVAEQLQALWTDALVDAGKSYQAVKSESIKNANKTVFGEAEVSEGSQDTSIKNQLRDNEKIGKASINYNNKHNKVDAAILKVGVETMMDMAEAMIPYLDVDGILPPDIPGKTIFKNGSYGRSGENTTLCVRTLTYEDFKDRVADELGRPLTVSESLLVSQKIYDIAVDPQCIYCYVAADRKAYDEYIGEYWKSMDKYIKALRKDGDADALYKEYLDGRKDTAQQQKRWAMWKSIAKSGNAYISAKDVSTRKNREAAIAKGGNIATQIRDAQRYAQSASWAKTVYDYRAYKGDILKLTQTLVDTLNSEYGLRMYSFSDYTPAFIVENMQMIIDASVRGLKSLAYTKDTAYAKIFASTGQAINISCFAKLDPKTGQYVEDSRQGASWAETKELRNKFNNVGSVLVCTNDAMVEWALKQDWVDVVIPYHIVKTGTTIANEYAWRNYTSESADKKDGRNANIYPTEHNNDFDTYQKILEERGITPRFERFYQKALNGDITTDQYMKLVNEVRLPASELSAVVPTFDLAEAKKSFGINEEGNVIEGGFVDKGGYMGGWYRQGVDVNQEVLAVKEDIVEGKTSLDVDYGMNKGLKIKQKEMHGLKLSDRDSHAQAAIEEFGTTSDYDIAGFVLEDGKMLKLGQEGMKGVRHKKIESIFDDVKGNDAVNRFLQEGNIRINASSPGVEIGTETPATQRQLNLISRFASNVIKNKGIFYLDITDPSGEYVASVKYYEGDEWSIKYDIEDYYNRGDVPNPNSYLYSDREVTDISNNDYRKMYNHFGSTKNYDVAGYMLGNGIMLDFSGKHWGDNYSTSRQVDHRDISEIYHVEKSDNGVGEMVNMIANGNIRLMPETGGINLAVMPNASQINELRGYINHFRGEVIIDIDKVGGDTIHSWEYNKGTSSAKILSDIKEYFKNGTIPQQQSSLNQFLYSDRDSRNNFVEDKYFKSQMSKWKDLKHGTYVKVGVIGAKSPIHLVGMPEGVLRYDVDKLNKNMSDHDDYLGVELLKAIPSIIADPIAVSQYTEENTISVFGDIFVGDSPVMVGITISKDRAGNDINKVRTINARRDVGKLITDETILYLNEDKKRTQKWFQACGIQVPLGETKFGFIRSISQNTKFVNNNWENSDIKHQARDVDSMTNRYLLANALETAAKNDIEKNKLAQYKQKIELINAEEQKLHDLREQIKKLSFAKGRRDVDKIRSLLAEATQTANRISTYDRQLLTLEASKPLKGVLEREKQLAYKRAEQKGKDALSAYREKAAQTTRELMTRYQDARRKASDSRYKTEMRHKIKKVVGDLNQLLLHESKERNVKIGLKEAVASALEAVNMDTVSAESRIAELQEKLMKAKTPERIEEIQHSIDYIRNQGDNMADKLEALRKAYSEIKKSGEQEFSAQFKEEASLIHDRIESVIEKVGNTSLRDMNSSQLEAVYDMYKMVLTTIRNANSIFRDGKLVDLQQNASAVMSELDKIKQLKDEEAGIKSTIREFSWNEQTPYYAFRRIGSETFGKYFDDIVEGQNTYARDVDEAKSFADKTREKYGYKKWNLDKVYEFETKDGRIFKTTLKHLFSIYAYSKREQALLHMDIGGFFHNDKATFRKKGGVFELRRKDSVGYKIDVDTLLKIKKSLTKEQIAYVDEMQDYLTKMGEKGNEVTRIMWGIDIFKERVYFPLKSKDDFIKRSTETAQVVSLKNDGMTKETVPGASNPIVLEAFDDVWTSHIDRMSQYHAFVIPIDNLNKIHQYGTWVGTDSMSVSTMLAGRFGSEVNEYLSQFIKDLNGSVVNQGARNPLAGFFMKFKKTAVGASMSTIIQQPTAILRAMALVDAKYFVGKPNLKSLSKKWAELKKYAPIAIIKDIGGFDAGAGKRTTSWMNADTLRGVDKVMNTIDDFSMKGAELADQIGWTAIWEAVKRETKANNPNMDVNSEVFLEMCGKRMTDVIVQTQVYDSTLSRSGFMRSKNEVVKLATAFMGEPTLSFNMMFDAIIQAKRGGKEAKAQAVKTIAYVYASIIAASAAASLIYALRDDDDDETYLEKYLQSFGGEVISDIVLAPLTTLPFVKDIVSIFEGWDVERSDTAIFKDIKDAFDGLSSENKSTYRKIEDFTGAIAGFFGIPLKNLLRTGREAYNGFRTIFDDVKKGDLRGAFIEGITGKERSNGQQLYEAIMSGDKELIEKAKARFAKDDMTDNEITSAIESAMRKGLRDYDPRIREAAQAVIDGNHAERIRITREIKAEGNFSQDIIVGAINAEVTALRRELKEAK